MISFPHPLSTRFRHVPWSKIRLEHMHAWLYWSTFNAALPPQAKIPHTNRKVLDEAILLLEKRTGSKISSGSDPSVQPLLLTLDPINVLSRPFAWYVGVKLANICLQKWYEVNHGIQYGRFGDLESGPLFLIKYISEALTRYVIDSLFMFHLAMTGRQVQTLSSLFTDSVWDLFNTSKRFHTLQTNLRIPLS